MAKENREMASLIRILMGLAWTAASALAHAQGFPAKPVFVVLPYSAGGGQDIYARALAQRLTEVWGQPAQIENRVGANGIIGTEYVAKAAPDGYTLLFSDTGSMVLTPLLYKGKIAYEVSRDFLPVAGVATNSYGLVVSPKLPVKTMKELIELAKAKPNRVSYATFGIGSTVHLATEMVQSMSGITLNHIPYKGSGPALLDVSAGHVDMMISTLGSILPYVKSAKLRLLAVSTPQRHKQYPDVPTIAEAGIPGFYARGWWGIHAPRGTPRSVIEKINADVQKILPDPDFRAKNVDPQGYEIFLGTPGDLDEWIKSEVLRWGKIIRDANLKIE